MPDKDLSTRGGRRSMRKAIKSRERKWAREARLDNDISQPPRRTHCVKAPAQHVKCVWSHCWRRRKRRPGRRKDDCRLLARQARRARVARRSDIVDWEF